MSVVKMLRTALNFLKYKKTKLLVSCGSSTKNLLYLSNGTASYNVQKQEKLSICLSKLNSRSFYRCSHCQPLFTYLKLKNSQFQTCRSETNISSQSILNDGRLWKYVENLLNEYKDKSEFGKNILDSNNVRLLNLFHCMKELDETKKELKELRNFLEDKPDKELMQLAKDDFDTCNKRISTLENEVLRLLIPSDPIDESDVILEISAGVGGQEAMLFAKELTDMYLKFIHNKQWKMEVLDWDETDLGGLRHAALSINGLGAFHYLKYEGGVHRVQRVPKTEKSGRIHTSTVAIAVLPQPSEICRNPCFSHGQLYVACFRVGKPRDLFIQMPNPVTKNIVYPKALQGTLNTKIKNIAIQLNPKDLKILTKRASGAGGQHVNTTESAVQIIHIPTGIMVESQTDRSQLQNKNQALKKLRAKLYDAELQQITNLQKRKRRIQVGSSARSEKIRTYNIPQDRITDHRVGVSLHNLPDFMLGNQLDYLIAKVAAAADQETLMELIEDKVQS